MLSGCGSAQTLDRFDAQANAVCGHLEGEQLAIRTWREDAYVSRIADREFAAIPRPPASERDISQLAGHYFEEAAAEEQLADYADTKDSVDWRATAARFSQLALQDARMARRLGMSACAKALQPTGAAQRDEAPS